VPYEDFSTMRKYFCTTCDEGFSTTLQHDLSNGWPLRKLENRIFLGIKIQTAAEQTIVYLDAKGLWKLIESFISAGFTLPLICSAPCGTGQTTTDAGATQHSYATVLIIQWTATPFRNATY